MKLLYLSMMLVVPLLAFWLLAAVGMRIARARADRLPRTRLLPAQSLRPDKASQRRYQRLLRRKPQLLDITVAAPVPRRWCITVAVLALLATLATTLALPDGARFQVTVERAIGYPSTHIEVQLPAAQQAQLLQAWQPVLQQAARPVQMHYRIARTGSDFIARAVQPVQVRQRGDVLQLATALPLDHATLRQRLAESAGLAPGRVQLRDEMRFAPAWQPGWKALRPSPTEGH